MVLSPTLGPGSSLIVRQDFTGRNRSAPFHDLPPYGNTLHGSPQGVSDLDHQGLGEGFSHLGALVVSGDPGEGQGWIKLPRDRHRRFPGRRPRPRFRTPPGPYPGGRGSSRRTGRGETREWVDGLTGEIVVGRRPTWAREGKSEFGVIGNALHEGHPDRKPGWPSSC